MRLFKETFPALGVCAATADAALAFARGDVRLTTSFSLSFFQWRIALLRQSAALRGATATASSVLLGGDPLTSTPGDFDIPLRSVDVDGFCGGAPLNFGDAFSLVRPFDQTALKVSDFYLLAWPHTRFKRMSVSLLFPLSGSLLLPDASPPPLSIRY
jgi:hypothetical protein